jgi:hypothetical protein
LAGAVATIFITSSSLEPRAASLGDPMRNTSTIAFVTAIATASPTLADSEYESAIMASGPAAYWRFEEVSGDALSTASGAPAGQFLGLVHRGVSSATPQLGSCTQFTSGGVRIPYSANATITATCTLELWARATEVTAPAHLFSIGRDISSGSARVTIYGATSTSRSINADFANNYGSWPANEPLIQEWHHYVFVRDAASASCALYVDGQRRDQRAVAQLLTTTQAPIFIGMHDVAGFPYYFRGLIDEVAIYQRALTESEIRAHYCAAGIDSATCCPADLNQDSQVNGSDIAVLLGFWGPTGTAFPAADINQDGIVNGSDLAAVLTAWGTCAP